MQMIGQEKIKKQIEELTLDTLPHTLMIRGDDNDYQYEVLCEIGKKVNLPWLDITDALSFDLIVSISVNPSPSIYYIRMNMITEKEQNVILKFLEEPPENAWLILLTTVRTSILSTVFNRAVCWRLEGYTKEQLKELTNDPLLLKYSSTPMDIEVYSKLDLEGMEALALNVILNISKAYFSNCLVITSKMSFKDGDSGYPVSLFLEMLLDKINEVERMSEYSQAQENLFIMYTQILCVWADMVKYPALNREWMFNNLLLRLKTVMR